MKDFWSSSPQECSVNKRQSGTGKDEALILSLALLLLQQGRSPALITALLYILS